MKDKGFTIIELLAVIIILGLLMAIAIPSIINSQRSILDKINTEQEKNLKEAGRTLGVDLDDTGSEIFNCKGWIKNDATCECGGRDSTTGVCKNRWSSVIVTVDQLKSYGYFDDKQNKCNGSVKIEKNSSSFSVDLTNVTCNT